MLNKNRMAFEYNKTYVFKIEDTKVGDLPQKLVYELFQDGRVSSHFINHYIPIWFSDFEYKDGKYFDHLHDDNKKFECKTFTKGGCKFCPSTMIGSNRSLDESIMKTVADSTDYILCDVTEYPIVRVRFFNGVSLYNEYPSTSIPFNHRDKTFDLDTFNTLFF